MQHRPVDTLSPLSPYHLANLSPLSPHHHIILSPHHLIPTSSLSLSSPHLVLVLTSSLYSPEYSLSRTLYSFFIGFSLLPDFYLDPRVLSVSSLSSLSSFLTLSFLFRTCLHMLPYLGPCALCLLLSVMHSVPKDTQGSAKNRWAILMERPTSFWT